MIGGRSGESFTWNVPTTLESAQYAFEIEDSSGEVNYSVQFPISGDGSAVSATDAATDAASTAEAATTSTAPAATLSEASPEPSETTADAVETTTEEALPTPSAVESAAGSINSGKPDTSLTAVLKSCADMYYRAFGGGDWLRNHPVHPDQDSHEPVQLRRVGERLVGGAGGERSCRPQDRHPPGIHRRRSLACVLSWVDLIEIGITHWSWHWTEDVPGKVAKC